MCKSGPGRLEPNDLLTRFLLFLAVPIFRASLWVQRNTMKTSFLLTVLGVAFGSVIYTAPWDNWLILHHVWWFDWDCCWGIAVGALPLEELLFIFLIVCLGGFWTSFLYERLKPEFGPTPKRPALKYGAAAAVMLLWAADGIYLAFFTSRFPTAVFLAECLIITLPALAIQCLVCGDMLWHRRKFALMATLPVGLWLTVTAGTLTFGTDLWTVNPLNTFWRIPGLLPIEMVLFYQLAAALIVLPATTLVQVDTEYFRESLARVHALMQTGGDEAR